MPVNLCATSIIPSLINGKLSAQSQEERLQLHVDQRLLTGELSRQV